MRWSSKSSPTWRAVRWPNCAVGEVRATNSVWLFRAEIVFHLAGALASAFHAEAATATIRTLLVSIRSAACQLPSKGSCTRPRLTLGTGPAPG